MAEKKITAMGLVPIIALFGLALLMVQGSQPTGLAAAGPEIVLEQNPKTGEVESIRLVLGNKPVQDFNAVVTFPDNMVETFRAEKGRVSFPVDKTGRYIVTINAEDYRKTILFDAKKPMQIVPEIPRENRPVVGAVLGWETVRMPNYLLVWIFAAEIICAFIIVLTRLKPKWFRAFMAATYTALPFVVSYYAQSMWLAFAIIGIQTTILTALLFRQWKKGKSSRRIGKNEA